MTTVSLNSGKKKQAILALCILTYISAYLCRLNYASAILKIGADLEVNAAALGAVGSLFFISYAVGQLVNGFLGDRISPPRFILTAVVATGLLNVAMIFAGRLWVIALIWTVNGYVQSIFWGCCNRLLSQYYGDGEHHLVSTGMSLSMVAAYILSWAVLGKLLAGSPWQMYFLIPAVCAVLIIPVWYMMTRREPADFPAENDGKTPPIRRVFRIMTEEKLWLICAVCLCTGLVKEGIGLWAPVIFLEVLGGRFDLSLVLVILIPLGNFCGIMITNQFLKRSNCEPMKLMIRIFAFLALFALATVIFRSSQPGWLVLLIAAVSGMALGANSILMSYLPLSYSARHIVATLIGIFDSFAYIGAAFSAYGLGRFLDDDALIAVPILWFAAAVIAIVLIALRFFLQKRQLKCIMNE